MKTFGAVYYLLGFVICVFFAFLMGKTLYTSTAAYIAEHGFDSQMEATFGFIGFLVVFGLVIGANAIDKSRK